MNTATRNLELEMSVWWPLFGAWNILFPFRCRIKYWLAHWLPRCLTGASFPKPRHISFFTSATCFLQSGWLTPPFLLPILSSWGNLSQVWTMASGRLLLCSKPPTVPQVQNWWTRTEEHLWSLSSDQDQLRRSKSQEDYLIWRYRFQFSF